ncbi:uncharacterized protein LOC119440291 [Dermacentor silvarum]|uniref:uncharacterized protein LOC119440291 n=1 Tax=Dermacentor silvarum TaxID=543639 RepID=UPI00189AE9BA|nr:uncharacterized protein LOC119440291 [Dermacentor silvarum]
MALQGLLEVVSRRLRRPAEKKDVEDYLSGSTEVTSGRRHRNYVPPGRRHARRRMDVLWQLDPDGVRITCGDKILTSTHRRKVIRTLRAIQSAARDTVFHNKPNQGKVLQCVAADPASSHFMHSGSFTRLADWRFIHMARLNTLHLNEACPWMTSRDQRCRECGYVRKTLPHVLRHCMSKSPMYTARHNNIVVRLRTACQHRFTITYENRPVGSTNLRPDLGVARGEEAIVLDVCCPFDNRPDAFSAARTAKITKFEPVRLYLAQRYQRVIIDAAIVGAVG